MRAIFFLFMLGFAAAHAHAQKASTAKIVRIPLKLVAGVPTIEVRLNGMPLNFAIDTGSEKTILQRESALRCGVTINVNENARGQLSGMLGSEPAAHGALNSLTVGGIEWRSPLCLVRLRTPARPAGWPLFKPFAPPNALGMDALRAICSYVVIDYRAREAVLGLGGSFVPASGEWTSVPARWNRGLPYAQARAGNVTWDALIDTGSAESLVLDRGTAMRLKLDRLERTEGVQIGFGERGVKRAAVLSATLDDFTFGVHIPRTKALIVPGKSSVGSETLRHFAIAVDFRENTVWIRR